MWHPSTSFALALALALSCAAAQAAPFKPPCYNDDACDLAHVCQRPSGTTRGRPGTCVRDTTSPVAVLSKPIRYARTANVRLAGEVSDNRRVEEAWFSVDDQRVPTTYLAGQSRATATVSLAGPDGDHRVVLWARDAAGNVLASAAARVTLDTKAPELTLVAPADGAVLGRSDLRGDLTVYEVNPTEITVGATVVHHPGHRRPVRYRVSLVLPEGKQVLTATARDAAGNSSARASTVIVDLTAPTVALPSLPAYFNAPSLSVDGLVSDRWGVTKAWFTLDGAPVETRYQPGDPSAFADLTLSKEGAHRVVLWAQDAAGNLGSAAGQVTLDTQPPRVTLVEPADGAVLGQSEVLASVSVLEANDATIIVGGQTIEHRGGAQGATMGGAVTYQVTLTLPAGENLITVIAKDAAGNASFTSTKVFVDLAPPVVTTKLYDGFVVAASCDDPQPDNPFMWSFNVNDAHLTTLSSLGGSVTTIVHGAVPNVYNVNVASTLQPGTNVLSFVVTDTAGHATTLTRIIFYEPRPGFTLDGSTALYLEPALAAGEPMQDLAFNQDYLLQTLGASTAPWPPPAEAVNVIVLHRPDRQAPPDPYGVLPPGAGEMPFEGFRVEVTPDRIDLYSGDPRGQRYGAQWLVENLAANGSWCSRDFEDAPRLRLRAFHAGNFEPSELLAVLDRVAQSRLNVVQWQIRLDVKLAALGIAQGGACPKDEPGIDGTWPVPLPTSDIQQVLLAAAERHIVVVPSFKLLTHQEKGFADDSLYAVDRPCPDKDVDIDPVAPGIQPQLGVTVLDRVEASWPDPDGNGPEHGLLLPKVCPQAKPDCQTRVYNPTYVFPAGTVIAGHDVGGLSIYDGLVFPILDELVAMFSQVRRIPAVAIGHDETAAGVLEGLALDLQDGRTAARLFADDLLKIHDYLAAEHLWSVMWGDLLLPLNGEPSGEVGLEVSLQTSEKACLPLPIQPVYMEDAVHGERDEIGVRGPLGAFEMIASAAPAKLRVGDWHYFHPYADYPSNDYLAAGGLEVYGASWFRDDYIAPFTRDVVADGGHGMIATWWGLPAGLGPDAQNLDHMLAFSGATYWTGGAPVEGRFGWEPRPNRTPLDAEVLVSRVACSDLATDAPGVVTQLFQPGQCGRIWVHGEDVSAGPDDVVDPATFQGWMQQVGYDTFGPATHPTYVPEGAPGMPAYTWRLDFALPLDARLGSYGVKVQYSDAGDLATLTALDDVFQVGWAIGDNLVANPGFETDTDWYPSDGSATFYGNHPKVSESLIPHDAGRALCLAPTASVCSCDYDACGVATSPCECSYAKTLQRVDLPAGVDRAFLLRYSIHTTARHAAGPDDVWNWSTVLVQAKRDCVDVTGGPQGGPDKMCDDAPQTPTWVCWPDKVGWPGDSCSKRWTTGSRTAGEDDGWRAIEVVLRPPDADTHPVYLEITPYQTNKGDPSDGTTCYDDFELREVRDAPNLLFTRYVEGTDTCGFGSTSCNKAIAITNLQSDAVDLDLRGCKVVVYSAAGTKANILLTGTLDPGATHVVCHGRSAFAATCDQTANTLAFDGDDALALRCGATVVDTIGQYTADFVDVDPGLAWTSGSLGTAGHDLSRACTVNQGDPDGTNAFDLGSEWVAGQPDAPNAPTGLGSYSCP